MAVEYVVPYPVASDFVTYQVAADLFSETGHPVSESSIRRWVREQQLPVERRRGTPYVAFSDLLMVHAQKVAGQGQ
ncbi:hypothetical protein [Streptomyces sp. NPDC101145]|uniref:hypothetical protein n=1 Tax=Streptomyces sp. NPDC101145 TaxID=3366112 RepID=UPI0037F96919